MRMTLFADPEEVYSQNAVVLKLTDLRTFVCVDYAYGDLPY